MSEPTDSTANRETTIPAPVGERLQTAFGLDERPRTLTDWGETVRGLVDSVDMETLCTTDESPHEARFGDTSQEFICVQDAFIVPYLVTDDTVEIVTESPVSGAQITATATEGGVEVTPPGAVMSLGVAADPETAADHPATAYEQICPYGHAFPNRTEYEQWVETVDAATMAAPLADTVRLARSLTAE